MGMNRAGPGATVKGTLKMAKSKNKPASAPDTKIALLGTLVNAGAFGTYLQLSADLDALVAAGYAQTNAAMTTDAGIPARATEAGITFYKSQGSVSAPPAAAATTTAPATVATIGENKTAFQLVKGIPIPAASPRGRVGGLREATYPFKSMEIGDSFFVGQSEAMPEPWKQLTSTVSSAQRRFGVERGTKQVTRKNKETGQDVTKTVPNIIAVRVFTITKAEGTPWGFPGVTGAAIWRKPDNNPDAA